MWGPMPPAQQGPGDPEVFLGPRHQQWVVSVLFSHGSLSPGPRLSLHLVKCAESWWQLPDILRWRTLLKATDEPPGPRGLHADPALTSARWSPSAPLFLNPDQTVNSPGLFLCSALTSQEVHVEGSDPPREERKQRTSRKEPVGRPDGWP